MGFKKRFDTIVLVTVGVILTACGGQATASPTPIEVAARTPIPPTATSTPSPIPTQTTTPTVTPTPPGGRNGLLLMGYGCDNYYHDPYCKMYTYDLNTHKTDLFLEGYSPIGTSPDGRKILTWKSENGKTDLFSTDLSNPAKITLLSEDISGNPYSFFWFPESEWIGFIAEMGGIPQVFIIRSDGSELTQVTNSSVGALHLLPAFNEGVFWGEGSGNSIKRFKWTKLDGTETIINSRFTLSPNGKYMVTTISSLQKKDCFGHSTYETLFEWKELQTGETGEVCLTRPDGYDGLFSKIQPLSPDTWFVWSAPHITNTGLEKPRYWIYSTDGTLLLDFADLPHKHADLPEGAGNLWDYYRIIGGGGGDLSGQRLSPDGNLLIIEHRISIEELTSTNIIESTYYLLNLSTFEIQQLAELVCENWEGICLKGFFWVELP